jgi:uncharacterized UPF0146 family protein
MIPDTLSLLEDVNSIEQDRGIGLVTRARISVHDQRVCAYPRRDSKHAGNQSHDREFEPGRGSGIPKNKEIHYNVLSMGGHKHIERCIGACIASRYRSAGEVGVGDNFTAAETIRNSGGNVFCTDVLWPRPAPDLPFYIDNIFSPDIRLYQDVEVIYSVRPGEEMVPALIRLARYLDVDLVVYHLGFEGYGRGGEILDCRVPLHRYHKSQNPSKSVF